MKHILFIMMLIGLVGCQTFPPKDERMEVSGHLDEVPPAPDLKEQNIPPAVAQLPIVEVPKPAKKLQTFTVVVNDLPATELLFALARDARLNLDIDPAIEGNVSINAIDQTLPQILKRISRQVSLHYYIDGPNMVVEQDLPFMRIYRVDYLNIIRNTESDVSISTQIASTGTSVGEGGGGGSNSSTDIANSSSHDLWKSLEENITSLISSDGEDGIVIINRESGTLSVKATASAHESVQEFIDTVMSSVRKQVLIEATVVEVTLNDDFQAGVDWSRLANANGWSFEQSLLPAELLDGGQVVEGTYTHNNDERNISGAIKALDAFGDVSVMSSPKIMAINNQTSILKVVDNRVYFTTEVEEKEGSENSAARTTYTSTIHTVPVGFVMNVTPYITNNDEVMLNIRPTISRILDFVEDPISGVITGAVNKVPEIQVREMESVLRVANGDTAIIGGLMQDSVNESSAGIPGLHDIEGAGLLFGTKERRKEKTELVIFLRPRIIESASLNSDLSDFKKYLKPRLLSE